MWSLVSFDGIVREKEAKSRPSRSELLKKASSSRMDDSKQRVWCWRRPASIYVIYFPRVFPGKSQAAAAVRGLTEACQRKPTIKPRWAWCHAAAAGAFLQLNTRWAAKADEANERFYCNKPTTQMWGIQNSFGLQSFDGLSINKHWCKWFLQLCCNLAPKTLDFIPHACKKKSNLYMITYHRRKRQSDFSLSLKL